MKWENLKREESREVLGMKRRLFGRFVVRPVVIIVVVIWVIKSLWEGGWRGSKDVEVRDLRKEMNVESPETDTHE